jgi:hypothetical protein
MTRFTCIVLIVSCLFAGTLKAQDEEKKEKAMEIYGFIMTDAGHNFNQMDPNWFDVMRPTKLPAYDNQFGADGNTYFSVRQTRFGVKNWFPTCFGELKTQFEMDMFGVGVDAGQTTIRPRHYYGQIGHFGAGQTNSPFMDGDVFPNCQDYWGPNGMLFFRNVQVRYTPIMTNEQELIFALERPGASADAGIYRDRIALQGVSPRFPYPDFSAAYRYAGKWGYVRLSGMLRSIQWVDQNTDTFNLSGDAVGWGGAFSTNIYFGKNKAVTFRGQIVYGEGIQNYFNDAPVDIGIQNNYIAQNVFDPHRPVIGVALPILGATTFLDVNWNKKWTSAMGWSLVHVRNSNGQSLDAYKSGNYVLANIQWHPDSKIMMGVEGEYFDRENYGDGWRTHAWKVQFSFRYDFSHIFYRKLD